MTDDGGDVEIGGKGVVFKGAYEDLRPVIRRSVAIADTVLTTIENAIGLPADFLNHHLGAFRTRYQERLDEIPAEKRDLPPFRLGCQVLKEVVMAAEEPDLQQMFADLLGTSSNSESKHLAHPGYPAIISQLTPMDAKILRAFVTQICGEQVSFLYETIGETLNPSGVPETAAAIELSVENLVRLGLLEWNTKTGRLNGLDVGSGFLRIPIPRPRDSEQAINGLSQSLKSAHSNINALSEKVARAINNVGSKTSLAATVFGQQFVAACMPAEQSDIASQSPPNTNPEK